jgi:hypothetical protein
MPTLTGWIDYDRPHLTGRGPAERVDYLEKRTRLVAINPLRRILDNELHPRDPSGNPIPDCSALLIFGVAVCCFIESLGKFVTGGGSVRNHERFDAFLCKYLTSEFQNEKLSGKTYGYILRKSFRNGLAHGFAVERGGFEGGASAPYFTVVNGLLRINPRLLLEDLCNGFDKYLSDLRAALPTGALYVNFDKVFISDFIKGE